MPSNSQASAVLSQTRGRPDPAIGDTPVRWMIPAAPRSTFAALGAELGPTDSEAHAAVERAVAPGWRSRRRVASPQWFAPP